MSRCGLSAVSLCYTKEQQQHIQKGALVKQEFVSEKRRIFAAKGEAEERINNGGLWELRDLFFLFCFVS